MKEFIYKGISFVFPIPFLALAAYFVFPFILGVLNGPSTKFQIEKSFDYLESKDVDLLILGNSRVYRGINPSIIQEKAFNFAHDNDTYNQLYYKLVHALKVHPDMKEVVLGVDYFQFSFLAKSRNYAYADVLPKEYLKDYNESQLKNKLLHVYKTIYPAYFVNKLKHSNYKHAVPFYKENGQFIKPGKSSPDDMTERDFNRLEIQIKYFGLIVDLCKENDLTLYLVMPPLRDNELTNYTEEEIKDFKSFIGSYTTDDKVHYLDFSVRHDFDLNDFTDLSHLNESGADAFSTMLRDDIIQLRNSYNK